MKNKVSIVIATSVILLVVLWYLVRRGVVSNPMWNDATNKAYKDILETYGSAMDVNITPGGGAIWTSSELTGLSHLQVMDKNITTCCPYPSDAVVRASMRIQLRHPYIATAIMSINPEIVINQGKSSVEVKCAALGCCLVLLAYIRKMTIMPFDQFMDMYQRPSTDSSSFYSEASTFLRRVMEAWDKGDMDNYNILKREARKIIDDYQMTLPSDLVKPCKSSDCRDSVFNFMRFGQAPDALLSREAFTTDRIFVEDGEYIEEFTHSPNQSVKDYTTFRHNNTDRPQLPAYDYTTLGGGKYACGDGIVGCSISKPMYRIAKTHEINSCANPKTMYSIEPVSLKDPSDPFALGEKSYPAFSNDTYHQLTHSLYSPSLPTRTAK